MNNLSWLIYAAGVSGNVQGYLVTIGILCGLASAAFVVLWLVFSDTSTYSWEDRPAVLAERKLRQGAAAKYGCRAAVVGLICGFLSTVIPSGSTLYAIAASEMGEAVLESETGGKAVEALNAWLDRQIEGAK